MAYTSNTFAMDPTSVSYTGKAIADDAMNDLSYSKPLVPAVMGDENSMPTMFTYALTTFYQNLDSALSKLFNQRYEIGQALRKAASKTELDELKNVNMFIKKGGS